MKLDAIDEVIFKVYECMRGVPRGLFDLGVMTREAHLAACVGKERGGYTLSRFLSSINGAKRVRMLRNSHCFPEK